MSRLQRLSVWVLLSGFLVGGVLGPVLHRVHHAVNQGAIQAVDVTTSPRSADSAVPALAPTVEQDKGGRCSLCARRLIVAGSRLEPVSTPTGWEETTIAVPSSIISIRTGSHHTIRGPPGLRAVRVASA